MCLGIAFYACIALHYRYLGELLHDESLHFTEDVAHYKDNPMPKDIEAHYLFAL